MLVRSPGYSFGQGPAGCGAYCATMLGFGTPEVSALLLSGIIAKPYYLGTVALCALVCGPARRRGIGRDTSALPGSR